MAARHKIAESEVSMLIHQYGVLAPAVLDYIEAAEIVGRANVDAARVVFAKRHEMAIQPRDCLEVSTSLGLEGQDTSEFSASI
jgi:glycerol-3-phosphate dehydrogenase